MWWHGPEFLYLDRHEWPGNFEATADKKVLAEVRSDWIDHACAMKESFD
jgi:hypothetical protein